jgi:hypothetical protein
MRRPDWFLLSLLPVALTLAGCGKPTLPGKALRGQRAVTSTEEPRTEAPKQAVIEAGPADAKVRVVGFFALDSHHKPVIDTMKGLATQYPGKVYVKCVDPQTPEGQQLMASTKSAGIGVMINGESTVVLKGREATPLNFGGEMGRYWTAEDLKAAVAQEVAKAPAKRSRQAVAPPAGPGPGRTGRGRGRR